METHQDLVSIIIPAHNASPWIDACLESACNITYRPLEVSVFDDVSKDDTLIKLQEWAITFREKGINYIYTQHERNLVPRGAGYARNQAVKVSSGEYLCFMDADDWSRPDRVHKQIVLARRNKNAIVGSQFVRDPPDSTWHYAKWANDIQGEQLVLQQYRECTLILPTWFMHRSVFDHAGGFRDTQDPADKTPIPEDLLFFLQHLSIGGELEKVFEELVIYRHHTGSVSGAIPRLKLLKARLLYFEKGVLQNWNNFTIWGYGRDGKNVYNNLSLESKRKVIAFCDIDPKKIGRHYYCSQTKKRIPIIHFTQALPPIVCCVAMGRSNGQLENNVANLPKIKVDNSSNTKKIENKMNVDRLSSQLNCGDIEEEEDDDLEEMVVLGPKGPEWGGPTRGGRLSEPTRFGDWERKGRCSDF